MTIFKTAYDTTACQGFQMGKTTLAVERANISGRLSTRAGGNVRAVEGGDSVADDVPDFSHALWIKEHERGYVAFDARPFGRIDRANMQFMIRNQTEYDLAATRAQLTYIWLTQSPSLLRDISPLGMSLFAAWISESVTRRFVLDPQEQLRLAVLAGWFYASNFVDGEITEADRLRMVGQIAKATNAKAELVFEITEELPVLANLSDFCERSALATGSVRLEEMNPALLISLLGGTWFGHNAKEMIAVALEHPPTWLAIICACFQTRTYKNSQIAKLAEAKNRQNAGENFLRAVLKMCDDLAGKRL